MPRNARRSFLDARGPVLFGVHRRMLRGQLLALAKVPPVIHHPWVTGVGRTRPMHAQNHPRLGQSLPCPSVSWAGLITRARTAPRGTVPWCGVDGAASGAGAGQ